MTCLEARKYMGPFIKKELSEEDLREFLLHIQSCRECREELEVTHMVYTGVEKLDSMEDDLNLEREYRRDIEAARFLVFRGFMRKLLRYALDTLAFYAVLIALARCFFLRELL